jgi:plasmid stabilization system protein ParE
MAYLVNVTPRAQRDLDAIYAAINAEFCDAAFRWFNGLESAILTSEETPERCPVTPEDASFRHLLYGRRPHVYRVIYRIAKSRKVDVLHIRHGARQAFKLDELR